MRASVVLASCREATVVAESIDRLAPQCRAVGAELIVSRAAPAGNADPVTLPDGCLRVDCLPTATLPQIRGAGLAAARGDVVLLTEDNCVARPDWVTRMLEDFATSGADIVGGTMGNAHPGRAVDAAAYFAEYGFFGEGRATPGGGASPMVTGANVGYRRAVVDEAARLACAGEWEGVIHHQLVARGARVSLARGAVVDQNLHYTIAGFCRDRFEHARVYASVRAASWMSGRRLMMAAATPLLPALLTWRAWQSAGRVEGSGFFPALPCTLLFFSAWAAGEAVGYLRGGGQ